MPVFRVTLSPSQMPANGSGPQSLRWSVKSLPRESDILLRDPDQKAQVLAIIASLPAARPKCNGAFYLDPANSSSSCSLRNALSALIRFAGPAPYDKPPVSSATAPSSPVTVLGLWVGKALPTVSSLCIVAATGSFETDCSEPDAAEVSLGSLATTCGLGLVSPQDSSIRIRTHGQTSAASIAELQKVAVSLYRIAAGLKIAPGARIPPGAQSKVEQAAVAAYQIKDSNWPVPRATFRAAPAGLYILTLGNLTIVSSAAIVLTRGNEAVLQTPAIEEKLARRRKIIACKLNAKYSVETASIVGTIPTTDSAWKISQIIGRSPELYPPVIPQPGSDDSQACDARLAPSSEDSPHRMEFTAVRRAVVATLSGTANAGFAASSHNVISANSQMTESHLLLKNSETWGDTGSLNIDAGAKVQTANLSFGFGRSVGVRQTLAFGVDTDSLYLRDRNQRYGYLAGPKFVDEEYGANPNVYVTWMRPISLYALNAVVTTSLGVQFRHVLLEPPAAYPPFLNHGQVNGFDPTFSAVVGYDFTHSRAATRIGGGLGQVFVKPSTNFLAARPAVGDFNFNRYSASASAELFFGVTGTDDFLVRYDRGVSASSSGTPLFELPQMGGAENIRSIEQGEFVGRALGFERSELAVNAVSAWHWIRGRHSATQARPDPARAAPTPSATAPAKLNPSLASLGITGIYIGGLYDRAHIGPDSALSKLFDLSHGVHGSGVEGEVRGLPAGAHQVNIDFIYSRSPESILHRNGVFITSVSLDF